MSGGSLLVGAFLGARGKREVEGNLLASNKMLWGFGGVQLDWVGARLLVGTAVALVGDGVLVGAGFSVGAGFLVGASFSVGAGFWVGAGFLAVAGFSIGVCDPAERDSCDGASGHNGRVDCFRIINFSSSTTRTHRAETYSFVGKS